MQLFILFLFIFYNRCFDWLAKLIHTVDHSGDRTLFLIFYEWDWINKFNSCLLLFSFRFLLYNQTVKIGSLLFVFSFFIFLLFVFLFIFFVFLLIFFIFFLSFLLIFLFLCFILFIFLLFRLTKKHQHNFSYTKKHCHELDQCIGNEPNLDFIFFVVIIGRHHKQLDHWDSEANAYIDNVSSWDDLSVVYKISALLLPIGHEND